MHLRGWPHQYYFRAGLDLTIFWFWFICCWLLIGILGDILILWSLAGQYFCHSHQRCRRQSTFHRYVGEAKGVRCPASVNFAHVVFPRGAVRTSAITGYLTSVPAVSLSFTYLGGRFGGIFMVSVSVSVLEFRCFGSSPKKQHGFSSRRGLEDQCFYTKKVPSKRELIHTKGSNKNHETFHLPWEFSCHLTSTSGRWKLHCIHHSCSSGRFLDARIGGWLGSQNSFRKNVDEKPANFMILVDEHPSFSTINIAWTNLGTHQLLLVEMCNLCETAAMWLHWCTLAIARR